METATLASGWWPCSSVALKHFSMAADGPGWQHSFCEHCCPMPDRKVFEQKKSTEGSQSKTPRIPLFPALFQSSLERVCEAQFDFPSLCRRCLKSSVGARFKERGGQKERDLEAGCWKSWKTQQPLLGKQGRCRGDSKKRRELQSSSQVLCL
mmetsp:Transcript_28934/g.61627  ORF Transcript_28934/g.61627 Transcript_28934/m.61627 type:complete len:152 (+) Transcript_28934:1009-1464(+)